MRFEPTAQGRKDKSSIAPIIWIIIALIVFITSLSVTATGNDARQKEYLEKALTRNVVYAYATTGQYPDTLETIETKYGLIYDKDKFYIDYRALGRNVYPKITVLEK